MPPGATTLLLEGVSAIYTGSLLCSPARVVTGGRLLGRKTEDWPTPIPLGVSTSLVLIHVGNPVYGVGNVLFKMTMCASLALERGWAVTEVNKVSQPGSSIRRVAKLKWSSR